MWIAGHPKSPEQLNEPREWTMVKPFEITTATGDIPLDSAGHGTAVFTVTNTTQHSIKAIAKVAVQPDNSPAAGWIKIVPRDEIGLPAPTDMRLLSAGLIDDYKLQIDVPVDAASGRYSFNLISAMRGSRVNTIPKALAFPSWCLRDHCHRLPQILTGSKSRSAWLGSRSWSGL